MPRKIIVPHNTPLVTPWRGNYFIYRFFEMLPGLLSWATLILCVTLSFIKPLIAVYIIILYDLYWLIRVAYLSTFIINSWRQYRRNVVIDWFSKLKQTIPAWPKYQHLIFLPTYKEPYEVVAMAFKKIIDSQYDLKKITIVLAGEGRVEQHFTDIVQRINQEFAGYFNKIIITVHPADVANELPSKGSNLHYTGPIAQQYIDSQGWNYDEVIVSAFDIDTWVHPQYLAALTYKYATVDKPTRISYQPLALYHNNIWQSDPLTRVVAYSTTFWLLTDLARAERLFTFSSHSMSFRALVDVGFWEPDVVSDDSRIFLQCLLRYQGDYRVEPIYVPVSMSTVYMGKFWRSIRNQYLQIRRWAWGVENFPYMAWHFLKGDGRKIPVLIKIKHLFNYLEGNYSWATSALVITILGFLPFKLAAHNIQQLAIMQNAPDILRIILSLAMIGLIINAILGTWMLPAESPKKKPHIIIIMILQYALVFITMIAFGAVPALDAQTRHILGGRFRLGFWNTEKSKT